MTRPLAEVEVEAVAALWLGHLGDPAGLAAAAREMVPTLATAEGRAALTEHLRPWWEGCQDAREMLRWLGSLAAAAGDSSPAHRRVALLACLCARTAPRSNARSLEALALVEAWAWGGPDRRQEAHKIVTAAAAYAAVYAADAADAVYAVADAAVYAVAAADAADAWGEARTRHLAAMADLIRAAVSLGEVLS